MEKINSTLTFSATDVNVHDFYTWGWGPLLIDKYVTHPGLKKPLLQICASQARRQGGGGGAPCLENGQTFLEEGRKGVGVPPPPPPLIDLFRAIAAPWAAYNVKAPRWRKKICVYATGANGYYSLN